MQREPSGAVSWPFAMLLVAIGGAGALGGVLLGWWEARAFRETEIFGRELVADRLLAGTAGWGGVLALASGVLAVVAGLLGSLAGPAARRRSMALAGVVLGALALAGAALGPLQGSEVGLRALGAAAGREVEVSTAGGLPVSALGGLLALAGGLLALRSDRRGEPAEGHEGRRRGVQHAGGGEPVERPHEAEHGPA